SVLASNPRVSRSQAHQAKKHAAAHDSEYASVVTPAFLATNHPAIAMTIHPTGWPTQKMYSVWRMIFRPRVPPRKAHVTAAKGMARAAAQNAALPWSGRDVRVRPSHPARKNTTTPRAMETTVAITADLRTSGRTRPCSPRPTRIATRRTLATSIPNLVAVDAMNANCVA